MTRRNLARLIPLIALLLVALGADSLAQRGRSRSAPSRSAPSRVSRPSPSRSVSRPSPSRSSTRSAPRSSARSFGSTSRSASRPTVSPRTSSRRTTTSRPLAQPVPRSSSTYRHGGGGSSTRSLPSSSIRYVDRGGSFGGSSAGSSGGPTIIRPGTTPSSSGSSVRYGDGPSRSYGGVTPSTTGTTNGSDTRGSSSNGDGPLVIDLSNAVPERRIPLPRFTDSRVPDKRPGQVGPSAGYTARSRTRPSPTSAAKLPTRSVTSADIMSRYRGGADALDTSGRSATRPGSSTGTAIDATPDSRSGTTLDAPRAATGTRTTTGTRAKADVPLLSERRRAPGTGGTRSVTPTPSRTTGAVGDGSSRPGAGEPTTAQLRERAAAATQKRQRKMNQLAKKSPDRARDIGDAGIVLGKALETGLDVGTRVLTGGAVGAGDLLGKRGDLSGRGTGGGGGRGGGAGGPGDPGDLGGLGGLGGAGGRGGNGTPPPGDVDPGAGGTHHDGSYYDNGYHDPGYGWGAGVCWSYYGWCNPYAYCGWPWVGWGWRSCWSSYWYGFGYCWGPWFPRYSWGYAVPIYQVTTQVVYETVEVPAEEEIVYVETSSADVNAFTAEPPAGPQTLTASQALARASEYYLTLGDRAFRDGKYGDAVHFYAKAVEFGSSQGVLYMVLADALFATGDYHYAAFAIRKALELDPNLVDGMVDKRGFYTDPTEFDRQLELLERYVEDHFLDQDARLVLTVNYLFAGNSTAALELIEDDFSKEMAATPVGTLLQARLRVLAGK